MIHLNANANSGRSADCPEGCGSRIRRVAETYRIAIKVWVLRLSPRLRGVAGFLASSSRPTRPDSSRVEHDCARSRNSKGPGPRDDARGVPRKRRSVSLVLLQTVAPDYRARIYETLAERSGLGFSLYAGSTYFEPSVRTNLSFARPVTNRYLFGRRVLVQVGMWRTVLRADVAIFELNPRILSNWWLLVARRSMGRGSIVWGHAWPRAGARSMTDRIRGAMRSLADVIVVYTERQADELRMQCPERLVIAAPNSLYLKDEMSSTPLDATPRDFIYVGRLVGGKKPELLLRAFASVADDLAASRLWIVGDGPLRDSLVALSEALGVQERVRFTGHVSDLERLRIIYGGSLASVSPGYVGLSITQSFAFGVPMLVARDEPHSPEIEAAIEDFNTIMFPSDSVLGLATALVRAWNERESWLGRRAAIMNDCASRYSVEHMADRVLQAVQVAAREDAR